MKAAGLTFLFLFVWGIKNFSSKDSVPVSLSPTEKKFLSNINLLSLPPAKKVRSFIDTTELKKTDWYAEVKRNIEESDYEISPGKNNFFLSNNRAQALQAFYTSDQFILKPNENNSWKLELQLNGVYTGKNRIYSPQKKAIAIIEKNKLTFDHDKKFAVQYINTSEGIRQNFIIEQQPVGNPKSIYLKLKVNRAWFINKVHNKEIHFAKWNGNHLNKKIIYNDLKVWDAENHELYSHFKVSKNEVEIVVNAADAIYPIIIDPLSTSPTTLNGTSTNDYFGVSVASAGDVNGDGYSDVIVGAYGVSSNTGKAYLFLGSATGLSVSAATILSGNSSGDHFGYSVSSAGDVNGDGYSDVVVGAYGVNSSTGAVYVYLGSPGGLSSIAATTINSVNSNEEFGWSVATAGDVNGDGYSDVIVGAWDYNPFQGRAYIFLGSSSGLSSSIATTLQGTFVEDRFGWSVACAGDVNGDGYSDVIVGLWGTGPSLSQGKADVFLGSSSGLSSTPSTILSGLNGGDEFGYSVASAGDINGDGYSDVIVGAPGVSSNKGAAYLFLGSSSGLSSSISVTLNGISSSDQFGQSVACAGDINGDGYSDIIIGAPVVAPSSTGAAYLFLGSASGLSTSPSQTLSGISSSSSFGYIIASAGDVNGDGYSDIIVGAPNQSGNTGSSFVYTGSAIGIVSTASLTLNGSTANDYFGCSVANAGDVNGDGFSDVIVGADQVSSNTGAAYLFLGSSTGLPTSPAYTWNGVSAGDYFGESVACAGDINGDGYSDVIVGAPNRLSNQGEVYIFLGSSSSLSSNANIILAGLGTNSYFGISVAGAGDVNNDGYGDVLVGAYGVNSAKGRVYIFKGGNSGLTSFGSLDGNATGDQFGVSVGFAGDVNGDGYSDVIIGAQGVNSLKGASYVFKGGPVGLSSTPDFTLNDPGNVSNDQFGVSVAGIGDINGDGYSDVIVGAHGTSSNKGAAYIYLGSSSGLNTTPATSLSGYNSNDYFGVSVGGAGDVNGDGYSDVIVGAYQTNSAIGAVYIFLGSSSGLNSSPYVTLNGLSASGGFGYRVAGVGDVNGDGFSDVMAGAPGVSSSQGAAYLFYGNGAACLRNNLRLYNSDLVTPISQANFSNPGVFGAGLYAKSFLGRQNGKMAWETVWNGQPFSGNPITNGLNITASQPFLADLGTTGTELKSQIGKRTGHWATYIRARIKYQLTTAITGQVYGPWRYPEGFLRGKRDIGAIILPVRFISFNAVKQNTSALLTWSTTDEDAGVIYEVQHSVDGIQFESLITINGSNNQLNQYQWLHTNPPKGRNYYRIRAITNNKEAFSQTKLLRFDQLGSFSIYPNPVIAGNQLTITSNGLFQSSFTIELINTAGQLVWQQSLNSSPVMKIQMPSLVTSQYILKIISKNDELYSVKILIQKE